MFVAIVPSGWLFVPASFVVDVANVDCTARLEHSYYGRTTKSRMILLRTTTTTTTVMDAASWFVPVCLHLLLSNISKRWSVDSGLGCCNLTDVAVVIVIGTGDYCCCCCSRDQ